MDPQTSPASGAIPPLDCAQRRAADPDLLDRSRFPQRTLRWSMVLVGWGVFVSTISQTGNSVLAELPLRHLLQDKIGPVAMASFFATAMIPWYCKPIAGLFSDAYPLFGTRRKSYLILGALTGGTMWVILGLVPHTLRAMLGVAIAVNVGLVIISSAIAGVLVEDGQVLGATGRLTAARIVVMSSCSIFGGLLGGVLATQAFGITAGINAALILSLVPLVVFGVKEPRTAIPNTSPLLHGWVQIKRLIRSGTMWAAAGMLFLIIVSPGFSTPLYDHLTHDLNFSLKFYGVLSSIYGAAGVTASFAYGFVCRRLKLRAMLVLALSCAAAGVLPFLVLRSRLTAEIAFATWGFGSFMAQLAALDLAARAAPRGVEAMGYALMVSAWNIGLNLSDVFGSMLWVRFDHHFSWLVFINAGTTLLAIVAVPFLPRRVVGRREGE